MSQHRLNPVNRQPCVAPGCDRLARTGSDRGLVCNRHYRRLRTSGGFGFKRVADLSRVCSACGAQFTRPSNCGEREGRNVYCSDECEAAGKRARALATAEERFKGYVSVAGPDECWPWTGGLNSNGYGRFEAPGSSNVVASRWAYLFATGSSPNGMFVCHSCDNPPCCNPRHLFLGTPLDNYNDMKSKGRRRFGDVSGERHPMCRLNSTQVLEIYRANGLHRDIAERFGISATAVGRIKSGRNWAKTTGATPASRDGKATSATGDLIENALRALGERL